MEPGRSLWHELPLGVQQHILLLTGNLCARRVSKAWRNALSTVKDTRAQGMQGQGHSHVCCCATQPVYCILCHRLNCRTCATFHKGCMPVARAAIGRLVKHSTSLTAVLLREVDLCWPALLTLSGLTASGAAAGLPTRLRKLAIDVRADVPLQLLILQVHTSLTHLDISHTQYGHGLELGPVLGKPRAAAQKEAFQNLQSLTYLRIQHCELTPCKLTPEGITAALQPLTQLQHLLLPGSGFGGAGVAALAPAQSAMPRLQTLDVGSNSLSGVEGAQALCTVLDVVPGLTHLDVSDNDLRRKGAPLLAPVLQAMTCLQTLIMRYTWMGHKGMAKIAPALAALSHPHTLDITCKQLSSEAMSALQPVLAREARPLRKLDLSHNQLGLGGGRVLASGLSASLQLLVLNLEATDFGQEDWPSPEPPGACPAIVEATCGAAAATVAAAGALQALTGLTLLQASGIFASVSREAIAPALMGMVRLQHLTLSQTPMHAEGTAAFALALPAFASSLTFLCLLGCSIDAEAASRVLAPALA